MSQDHGQLPPSAEKDNETGKQGTDDKKGKKTAEAVKSQPVKAKKVEEGPDPNGDQQTIDSKFSEPKGTRHTDQYNTAFPEEKNTVRP